MGILELTERAIELASKDEGLKEKTKDTVATIVMILKGGEDTPSRYPSTRANSGSRGGSTEPGFPVRGLKGELHEAHDREGSPADPFATKKLKTVKGSWREINKIARPLGIIPKKGKEIAEREGL
jgi:hypothetical protein